MPLGTSMNRFNVFIAVSFFEKSSKFLFLVFHLSLQYAHVLCRNIFDTVGMIIVISYKPQLLYLPPPLQESLI